jgi:putative aldouronate transport system permease protein
MKIYQSSGRRVFTILNYLFLTSVTVLCLVPLINVLAVSFSTSWAAQGGLVGLWPVKFTLSSYEYVMHKPEFLTAFFIAVERLVLGVVVNMVLTILAAYPLSKDKTTLRARTFYSWLFLVTILFSGGLIPLYMTIRITGLMDSIWALILPGAVPIFSVILLMNFFRQIPKEIGESAYIDGAGHWTTLWKIYVPLSMASIATLILFSAVAHWNSWFDGLIFMNSPAHYPLQSYLQTVVTSVDSALWRPLNISDVKLLSEVNDRTTKAAQVFLAAVPILCVYPFLQRYFMTGIVLGSVKG